MLVVFPDQVNALVDSPTPGIPDGDDWDERLKIVVVEATYLDYDEDEQEDDILTIFKILTPKDGWKNGKIEVDCAIEKPSGQTLAVSFDVKTLNGVEITIVWFNFVDEAGWYTLHISAEAVKDDNVGPDYIKHKFDPPKGDPGPPEIAIMSIEEL